MKALALTLATWFGCGYFPWGPGTAGSIAAVLLAALFEWRFGWGALQLFALTCILIIPAIWAATETERITEQSDPGIVVIDEVLGQWLTLCGATVLNVKSLLAGLLLFRIFDIWKPAPIRHLERLRGGVGIVFDDLAAGVYGALILLVGGFAKLY